jgi:hypothetical protein
VIVPEGRAYRGSQVSLDVRTVAAKTRVEVSASANDEVVLVLIEGSLTWGGERASRSSVFAERAAAVYLPRPEGAERGVDPWTGDDSAATGGERSVESTRRDGDGVSTLVIGAAGRNGL